MRYTAHVVAPGTCSLSLGPIRVALVASEACEAAPAVRHAPGAWRPRGEPSAFDLIDGYLDERENDRLRRELLTTSDYALLERHPGPGELEDYLIDIGMLEARRCRERAPLSEVLRQHDRVVASSLDTEVDGEALAARALTELAAKADVDLVFDQVESDDGSLVRAFAQGRCWQLELAHERRVSISSLVAFLNAIGREMGVDRCFVELDRAHHVTWGRWNAILRAARDGLFGFRLQQRWDCQVHDGFATAEDAEHEDELDLAYLEHDVVPPPRVSESVLELVAASARTTSDAVIARIIATIGAVLRRRYPGVQFDATYERPTQRFEPIALAEAAETDVEWMRERGAECEVGDELAYRLIPYDIEQAAQRWPALDLETVVSRCDHAIAWVLADCFAPDWLRRLPILLSP